MAKNFAWLAPQPGCTPLQAMEVSSDALAWVRHAFRQIWLHLLSSIDALDRPRSATVCSMEVRLEAVAEHWCASQASAETGLDVHLASL